MLPTTQCYKFLDTIFWVWSHFGLNYGRLILTEGEICQITGSAA